MLVNNLRRCSEDPNISAAEQSFNKLMNLFCDQLDTVIVVARAIASGHKQ